MIGVVVADDQAMVRAGFRMVLEAEGDIAVLADVGTGQDAVAAAQRLRPDVVLMDIRMPGMNGLDATRQVTGLPGAPRVVVVTTFDTDEYLRSALAAGASGFLLKDSGPRLLVEAVRAAADGDALVSPSVTVRLLAELAAGATPPTAEHDLTDRELEIVAAIARGGTNEEIAADLFVSLSTVKTHARNISVKLGARNRVEIAAWAWRTRLVS
ncbi:MULTISPECIES: response regulator [Cellulomonas]|uniref:DNA-binding NarL/FixJ family response regulator n=1 Tax=Cellulomonas iranensis TaxID=76862 RepID=A0ABU0GQR0_9CELL|nr:MULTISPECIES: response regulator transcription factor [Cellulomonas]MDQ0426955.1 DNA-binding NarL/FixJ family response regulator [Cellulomonas iranensis]TFH69442.1 response regulator transcription factor [Cellulomonas sp. HD19AZ1]